MNMASIARRWLSGALKSNGNTQVITCEDAGPATSYTDWRLSRRAVLSPWKWLNRSLAGEPCHPRREGPYALTKALHESSCMAAFSLQLLICSTAYLRQSLIQGRFLRRGHGSVIHSSMWACWTYDQQGKEAWLWRKPWHLYGSSQKDTIWAVALRNQICYTQWPAQLMYHLPSHRHHYGKIFAMNPVNVEFTRST